DRPLGLGVTSTGGLDTALAMSVRHDQTGIDGKALATDQALDHTAPNHRFEQFAQKVGVAEAAVACLGKGRVVWHLAFETQSAEPAIPEVPVNLLAKPAFRGEDGATAPCHESDC